MKNSQAISMDVMLAVVVFIGTIFVFYAILNANPRDTKELEQDAAKVLARLTSEDPDVGIMDGIEVDEAKLEQLLGKNYAVIKEQMRVDNDFCIFLEDENGDVIYISISPGQAGIGSSKIKISNIPCD